MIKMVIFVYLRFTDTSEMINDVCLLHIKCFYELVLTYMIVYYVGCSKIMASMPKMFSTSRKSRSLEERFTRLSSSI